MTKRLVAMVWLLVAVAWGAWIRVDTALADPRFDADRPEGMLRSDPALLYYFTERILEAGGGVPPDFHADARIQHPYLTDVPAEFPVGQEFLVAWAQRWLLPDEPLHVTALLVMAAVSALFVVGVFVGVLALTGSDLWASLAVLFALVTPANYRTIGFLLVGEDPALPLFALHLGWLGLAVRGGRGRDYLQSGLWLALALSTWHALGFVVLLELGVLWCGFLWSGRSPFEGERTLLVLVAPALAGLLVPVLRSNGWLVSPAAAACLGLVVPALVRRRTTLTPARARVLGVAVLALALIGAGILAPASYSHVHQVLWAKLRFLGRFPADPGAISFDARLLWQGPFETLDPEVFLAPGWWPLCALLALAVATHVRAREASGSGQEGRARIARQVDPERLATMPRALMPSHSAERMLLGFALLALPVAWLFSRLAVLLGLLVPASAVVMLARWPRRGLALLVFGALALVQASAFAGFVREHDIEWYLPRPAREELASLVAWVRDNVPADEPIAGDFVNSTALLAHTRHPIVLQPKYETDRSRRQAEAFLTTFFQGTPADFARLLEERFACRHVLIDRYVLWDLSRATAGLRADETAPRPGTAAELFLAGDPEALRRIEGFELLYLSPPGILGADYRLFRRR